MEGGRIGKENLTANNIYKKLRIINSNGGNFLRNTLNHMFYFFGWILACTCLCGGWNELLILYFQIDNISFVANFLYIGLDLKIDCSCRLKKLYKAKEFENN